MHLIIVAEASPMADGRIIDEMNTGIDLLVNRCKSSQRSAQIDLSCVSYDSDGTTVVVRRSGLDSLSSSPYFSIAKSNYRDEVKLPDFNSALKFVSKAIVRQTEPVLVILFSNIASSVDATESARKLTAKNGRVQYFQFLIDKIDCMVDVQAEDASRYPIPKLPNSSLHVLRGIMFQELFDCLADQLTHSPDSEDAVEVSFAGLSLIHI